MLETMGQIVLSVLETIGQTGSPVGTPDISQTRVRFKFLNQ